MARQNIQFKGMRHSPSDITGQDGDLLECVNLIHENGEMKPIEMPERTGIKGEYIDPKTGYTYQGTLAAVHNLTDGKKFVFVRTLRNGTLTTSNLFINIEGSTASIYEHTIMGEILWVETIGNTLIVGTDRSTHYVLYKNGQYKWLGDKLPQPVFEFDLGKNDDEGCVEHNVYEPYVQCTALWNDVPTYVQQKGGVALTFAYETLDSGDLRFFATPERDKTQFGAILKEDVGDIGEDNKRNLRDNFVAKMAKLTSEAKKEGRFIYPFMVRYAVRMFDGNYAMHSAPILMLPSTEKCPIMALVDHYDNVQIGSTTSYDAAGNIVLQGKSKPLKIKFKGFYDEDGNNITASVMEWSDIIKSIDVFLSSEVVTFNERYFDNINNFPLFWYLGVFPSYSSNRTEIEDDYFPEYKHAYAENNKESWYQNYVDDGFDINEAYYGGSAYRRPYELKHSFIQLESYSENEIQRKIEETHLFYKVKSYNLENIVNICNEESYLHNEIEYGLLDRLETLPILPDDYVSRSRMTGTVNYNYNQRLVLGNIKLQAAKWYQDIKRFDTGSRMKVSVYFIIEKAEKTIVVKWDSNSNTNDIGIFDFGHYLYYPDPDCKRAVIKAGNDFMRIVPMHEHSGLHGAYALMPELQSFYESKDSFDEYHGAQPEESQDRYYQMPNTIAMSSVANPFHFPATNFKDIGRTKVVGIAANTLDVSSGQWGQYPLYVFCSDGIIAVMIDGEGKMGGIQAVSADVLREPQGLSQPTLVQTGQALMFLTQRGVMAIAGTQINCLDEAMNGRHFNTMRELADVDYHVGAFANMIGRTSDDTAFRDFAASGFLAFDYAHHRVLLLRPDKDYQYVYSMNTGLWSKEIIYTNLPSFQLNVVPENTMPEQRSTPLLNVKPIKAAVNNYTEMYLQDTDCWLYKTMDVMGENNPKQLYQYGYLVSRPIRFGTDEYKTILRALHRFTRYADNSFVKMALYGSRDGVKYGRINTLRGMSYQYFIFVVYTYMKPNERYSYMTVDFETRLTNKLR